MQLNNIKKYMELYIFKVPMILNTVKTAILNIHFEIR